MTQTWHLLTGDVRERLADLPAASVQCCVTSPPYWGLRDYGIDGQLGLEPTPDAYVASMVAVFREVRRALRDDGTLWLNVGDSFSDKQLQGVPWRLAFALQADGWYLRSDIIWSKPNPMPESVTDRPTKSHEYVFLLTKSARYFYDAEAIKEPALWERWGDQTERKSHPGTAGHLGGKTRAELPIKDTKNARSVWTIATQPYPDAHFATFPEALPERCIKAGTKLGDTVLDPFAGSGTTGQVAVQLGRSFVGIELNAAYADLARTRIGGAAPLFAAEIA